MGRQNLLGQTELSEKVVRLVPSLHLLLFYANNQQNMKEKIQQQFNFVVKWKAGKRMFISDALSRSPVSDPPKDIGMAEA